jgi:hypothetical protein
MKIEIQEDLTRGVDFASIEYGQLFSLHQYFMSNELFMKLNTRDNGQAVNIESGHIAYIRAADIVFPIDSKVVIGTNKKS